MLNFPISPQDGTTYQGYVYNSSKSAWMKINNTSSDSHIFILNSVPQDPSEGDLWYVPNTSQCYIRTPENTWVQWNESGFWLDYNFYTDDSLPIPNYPEASPLPPPPPPPPPVPQPSGNGFIATFNAGPTLVLPAFYEGRAISNIVDAYYDCTIFWGDGTYTVIDSKTRPTLESVSHTYSEDGEYVVNIDGIWEGFNYTGINTGSLINVIQWGSLGFQLEASDNYSIGVFQGCTRLTSLPPSPPPTISNISNLQDFFNGCRTLNFTNFLRNWDIGTVTNLHGCFSGCTNLSDLDLPSYPVWDTSTTQDMSECFFGCTNLSSGSTNTLSTWRVGSVTTLQSCFRECNNLNVDLSSWDVSSVTNMSETFAFSFVSTDGTGCGLNSWRSKVSNVLNFSGTFGACFRFNASLDSWRLNSATTTERMFSGCREFNKSVSGWGSSLGSVTNMQGMFDGAYKFNQPIGTWDVSSVTTMKYMFRSCKNFNQYIGSWDTGNCTTFYGMFEQCVNLVAPFSSSQDLTGGNNYTFMFRDCTSLRQSFANTRFAYTQFAFRRAAFPSQFEGFLERCTSYRIGDYLDLLQNLVNTYTYEDGNNILLDGPPNIALRVGDSTANRDILLSRGWSITDGLGSD